MKSIFLIKYDRKEWGYIILPNRAIHAEVSIKSGHCASFLTRCEYGESKTILCNYPQQLTARNFIAVYSLAYSPRKCHFTTYPLSKRLLCSLKALLNRTSSTCT